MPVIPAPSSVARSWLLSRPRFVRTRFQFLVLIFRVKKRIAAPSNTPVRVAFHHHRLVAQRTVARTKTPLIVPQAVNLIVVAFQNTHTFPFSPVAAVSHLSNVSWWQRSA